MWTLDPVTTWFCIGDTIATMAGDDGREPAGVGATRLGAADAKDVGVAAPGTGAVVVEGAQAARLNRTAAMVRRRASGAVAMGNLTW
jgi:hypothetical protein